MHDGTEISDLRVVFGPRGLLALLGSLLSACAAPLPPELDMTYEQALARAEADERSDPDYKPLARKKVQPKLFRGALDCRMIGEGGVGLVIAVATDGTIAATYVSPETRATRCLARRAGTAELPPPPHAPFFVGASAGEDD